MTLLSDLVAVLLPAAARDLSERGATGALQPDDLISISRLLDVTAALLESFDSSATEHVRPTGTDFEKARSSAAADLQVIESARRTRA